MCIQPAAILISKIRMLQSLLRGLIFQLNKPAVKIYLSSVINSIIILKILFAAWISNTTETSQRWQRQLRDHSKHNRTWSQSEAVSKLACFLHVGCTVPLAPARLDLRQRMQRARLVSLPTSHSYKPEMKSRLIWAHRWLAYWVPHDTTWVRPFQSTGRLRTCIKTIGPNMVTIWCCRKIPNM